ncbi:(2Fe-2S)-binding protein [Litorivita sp. NS0012-18]
MHLNSPDCHMIICHCQRITDTDIHGAIDWMREADGSAIITPRKVYRALGKTPDCGSCMPLFLSTMRSNDKLGVPKILRDMRGATATA